MKIPVALLACSLALTTLACSDDETASTTTTDEPDAGSTTTGLRSATSTTLDPDAPLPPVTLALVADGLAKPVDMVAHPTNDTLYIVEQVGRVRRIVSGAIGDPVLDVTAEVSTGFEQGLLGLAFSPNGATAYINYTDGAGNTNVQALGVAADGSFDGASRTTLLAEPQPYSNHNGGDLHVTSDGMLFIGLGDGGSADDPEDRAQDPNTRLGKMLRIDPSAPSGGLPYTIPSDNPFAAGGGATEIYSTGLRNPWRYWIDEETGLIWIGDVGQNKFEEVNALPLANANGANFGWRLREGLARNFGDQPSGNVDPVHVYEHTSSACSITPGVVMRDPALPALDGAYIYGDFCGVELTTIRIGGETPNVKNLGPTVARISAFGVDVDGSVLVASLDGQIYRIVPA